jgi:hypothetical protein
MGSSRVAALVLGLVVFAACSDSSGPDDDQVAQCTAADADGNINAMAPFQARTFRGADVNGCMWVTGNGADYLLAPQFATDDGPRTLTRYALGSGGTLTAAAAELLGPTRISPALRFENALRRRERQIVRGARRERQQGAVATRYARLPRLQQIGDTRTFRVLASIPEDANDEPTYQTVTATIRYVGQNILIYVDQEAPTGPNGLSDAVLTELGGWFDRDLYPLAVSTFGPESDVDNNDRVIVLMTPVVNGLTPSSDCSVAVFGFFFGLDLLLDLNPPDPNSNRGEVFYSLVPDPQAQFGCARSVERVEESVPTVFIHEFQHMISFNHHVLINDGPDEETWLDEGLAHMAEEVAARFYENKYGPPPPPRLFNDTANIFIAANLANSYSYLENPGRTSLTLFESTGSLEERGASWLFLRWLADLTDSTVFRQLVQNDLAGIANVEAVAGESFETLFADFALALWTDSIPGHPRSSVPVRNRFKSRNLRQIYARLNQVAPTQFTRVYPLVPRTLGFGTTVQSSMYPGAMEYFFSSAHPTDPAVGFSFTRENGSALVTALRPQLGVFRLP